MFRRMIRQVYNAETYSLTGKIENIVGMSIEASGGRAAVGDICRIYNGDAGKQVTAEVVGFKNDKILLYYANRKSGLKLFLADNRTSDYRARPRFENPEYRFPY